MQIPRFVVFISAVGLMIFSCGVVFSQNYPSRPIRIVTSGLGGGSDFVARLIAQGISGPLGQPVVVDNRPTGVIPGEVASRATPDGYTLIGTGNTLWTVGLLQQAPYDAVKDFAPITLLGRSPSILMIHPSVPVNSVKELIALAKAKPGVLNYGSGGVGSSPHIASELFKTMAGVDIVGVTYKGGGAAISALMAGEVQLFFASPGSITTQMKAGKVKGLAITTAQPSLLAPGLPTLTASGLTGYVLEQVDGVLAPAKTPEAIIRRLNQEIVGFINKPDVKEKFFNVGVEIVGSTPEEFASFIKSDIAIIGKVIKDAGIRGR